MDETTLFAKEEPRRTYIFKCGLRDVRCFTTSQDPGPAPAAIAAMRDQLRGGGVQIATVPHLFCTSPELAQRMVALAELERSHRVLEPSAGMGVVRRAILPP